MSISDSGEPWPGSAFLQLIVGAAVIERLEDIVEVACDLARWSCLAIEHVSFKRVCILRAYRRVLSFGVSWVIFVLRDKDGRKDLSRQGRRVEEDSNGWMGWKGWSDLVSLVEATC